MKEYKIAGHESSYLPTEKEWKLVWSDEFDECELDMSKWDFRLSMMGKRHPAWTADDGIYFDGKSNVVFKLIEKDGLPVSSQLQTGYNFMDEPTVATTFGHEYLQWNIGKLRESKFRHGYGYYECRCRLQQKKGWRVAFWIQSDIIGASLDPKDSGVEIDIMESFTPGQVWNHSVLTGATVLTTKRQELEPPRTLMLRNSTDSAFCGTKPAIPST